MKKVKKYIGLFVVPLVLSGCAGMNSSFDCDKVGGAGTGCASMDQVNQMINDGEFNDDTGTSDNGIASGTSQAPNVPTALSGYQAPTPMPGEPVRYSETIQKIWIAPWQDTQGNYHEPSYVYTVLAPAHWVGLPVQAIQTDDN